MRHSARKSRRLGLFGGLLIRRFGKSSTRPHGRDLAKMDYSFSMRRMGFRLSDKVRDVLRFRWLRKIS